MAQALVPLKDLVRAKSRLAGLLSPSERRALVQAMVEDVLEILASHSRISRVTLVSDDPCAGLLADKYGVSCWPESALACRGLNRLIAAASSRLLLEGGEPLLVMHADLPLLTAADVSAAIDCQTRLGGLVVACDELGTGTNLLAFDAGSVPKFCFGPDSARKHIEAARAAAVPTQLLHRPGLALDVDEPRDLAALLLRLQDRTGGHAASLLQATDLGARIQLALATLADKTGHLNRGRAG